MPGEIDWHKEGEDYEIPPLPPLLSSFSIPRLDDKPQDLSVNTSGLDSINSVSIPFTGSTSSQDLTPPVEHVSKAENAFSLLWNEAGVLHTQQIEFMKSWDSFHQRNNRSYQNTAFLTEQSSDVFNSIQQHLQPSPHVRNTSVIQILENDLLDSLKLVVLGTSSQFHVWDALSQSFMNAGTLKVQPLVFWIEDKHTMMPQSMLQLFLDLGSHVRRIELFIHDFRIRSKRVHSTLHAFAHSLSAVLTYIQDRVSEGPLFRGHDALYPCCFASVWLHYAELGQIAHCLASLCRRNVDLKPEDYAEVPSSAVDLLSLVYEALEMHVQHGSSPEVTAIIAYILTVSSQPYIQALCKSVAFGQTRQTVAFDDQKLDSATFLDGDRREHWMEEDDAIDADGPFPRFIPLSLAAILPKAHKSLKLLETAQPAHSIRSMNSSRDIRWVWSSDEVDAALNGAHDTARELETRMTRSPDDGSLAEPRSKDYKAELAGFRIFDMEPGSYPSHISGSHVTQADVRDFITYFPSALSSVIPNLSLLCDLVFSPLQSHAITLSSTLLSVFLDKSSSLYIVGHLTLLRSHMLLTSHSFKSRLTAALFSDAKDPEVDSNATQSYSLLRYKSSSSTPSGPSHTGRWAIGLAPFLMARDIWPPGGADLSFLLRTVIVGSKETGHNCIGGVRSITDGTHRVIDEAEFRLGFAVRDLPAGTGRERWLDPLSIEALDFLYLDYKVPHPMDVLIPSTVLSKYQRVFAFLLRIMRVESAIRAVFRLMRTRSEPLFPTLSSSNQLLLQLRFVAHSFVNTLSAYVYETAIGANFDAFLSRIAACCNSSMSDREFKDVFSLAECHSSVMDDILSACLLRSSQRTTGDLLRKALELILEFCVLVGDLRDGRLREHKACTALEVLYAAFRKKVSTLVKALEILLEKDAKLTQRVAHLPATLGESEHRTPPGGTEALRHFLTRLDVSDWWKKW